MIIHKLYNPEYRTKMAAFDYDWTLVKPKDTRIFPKDIDDWELLYDTIIHKLRKYYEDGFMIVIFTNQTKQWKCEQVINVMKSLHIPMFIPFGNYKSDKTQGKPNTYIFTNFIGSFSINKKDSFYVGDALGRTNDWSDTDKQFADNLGIAYYSPEEIFHSNHKIPDTLPNIVLDKKTLMIMVGYPGSGKSTLANHICQINDNIHIISGDKYKSLSKMKKEAMKYLDQSLIFDATHNSKKKRQELIIFGNKNGYHIICIHMGTSFNESYKRNQLRTDKLPVPLIAYNVYKKYYDNPSSEEGFTKILI